MWLLQKCVQFGGLCVTDSLRCFSHSSLPLIYKGIFGLSKERPILGDHPKAHIHEIRRISCGFHLKSARFRVDFTWNTPDFVRISPAEIRRHEIRRISKDQLPGMVSPMFLSFGSQQNARQQHNRKTFQSQTINLTLRPGQNHDLRKTLPGIKQWFWTHIDFKFTMDDTKCSQNDENILPFALEGKAHFKKLSYPGKAWEHRWMNITQECLSVKGPPPACQ